MPAIQSSTNSVARFLPTSLSNTSYQPIKTQDETKKPTELELRTGPSDSEKFEQDFRHGFKTVFYAPAEGMSELLKLSNADLGFGPRLILGMAASVICAPVTILPAVFWGLCTGAKGALEAGKHEDVQTIS